MNLRPLLLAALALLLSLSASRATVLLRAQAIGPTTGATAYNVRVVTDASPDLTDLPSFINSTTSQWTTSEEKVWALFYWTHILKRQTTPIVVHGFEITDPIRNFNDYGFTMCSTPARSAGISMLALSVSSSSRTSSAETVSPSSRAQRAIVPSLTDSPRLGIRTSNAISPPRSLSARARR